MTTPSPTFRRRAIAAAAAAVTLAAACAKDPVIVLTPPSSDAAFMQHYVALGNSITAGFQSGGIAAATQQQSYARLLAAAAGTTYNAPYLTGPACAPYTTFLDAFLGATGSTTSRAAGQLCVRTSSSPFLNNVAVPGANSADPTGAAGNGANVLTTLILGGRTQVQTALAANPTFVSIWIGNNDVLGAALRGDVTLATALTDFQARYDAMINQLTAGAPTAKGVLVGVVDVTNVPSLIPAAVIVNSPQYKAMLEGVFLGGRKLNNVNCTSTTPAFISLGLILQYAATPASRAPAFPLACSPVTIGGAPYGAGGVVDSTERVTLSGRVAAYNAYIQQKAQTLGWAYYDPNTTLATLKKSGAILPAPMYVDPTTGQANQTAPYGTGVSLDGIHPSATAHVQIAKDIAAVIDAKYGSSLASRVGAAP